jgi:hypothetical protein
MCARPLAAIGLAHLCLYWDLFIIIIIIIIKLPDQAIASTGICCVESALR